MNITALHITLTFLFPFRNRYSELILGINLYVDIPISLSFVRSLFSEKNDALTSHTRSMVCVVNDITILAKLNLWMTTTLTKKSANLLIDFPLRDGHSIIF